MSESEYLYLIDEKNRRYIDYYRQILDEPRQDFRRPNIVYV